MKQKVLFVGAGKGSWQIRGKQLGKALGARVTHAPSPDDWAWADVVVLVKHAITKFGAAAKASGAVLIWDVLDWWAQPEDNGLEMQAAVDRVHDLREQYDVDVLIGATQQMADDIGGVYLPHHARPGLQPREFRDDIAVVAYEGQAKYLGSWHRVIARACQARGWAFVVNPPDLREADLIVAFRGEQWDGPICRAWKSGVKVVNALAAGRPMIGQDCAAMREIVPPSSTVADPSLLDAALDYWTPEARWKAQVECRQLVAAYSLDAIAQRMSGIIRSAVMQAA